MADTEHASRCADSDADSNSKIAVAVADVNQSIYAKSTPSSSSTNTNQLQTSHSLRPTSQVAMAASGRQQVFSLFDLPVEICLLIAKLVIDDAPPKHISVIKPCATGVCSSDDHGRHFEGGWGWSCALTPPPILQSCHVFRKEFRNYYYHTKITIEVLYAYEPYVYENLGRFLRMIGPEARRSLRPAYFDEDWVAFDDETPKEPPWSHVKEWEVELMLQPNRERRAWLAVEGYDTFTWDIIFL